jgi:hypothetical protein
MTSDKMSHKCRGQNVIGQNVTDKMSLSKCRGQYVVVKISWAKFLESAPILTSNGASMKVKGRGLVCKECWCMAVKLG